MSERTLEELMADAKDYLQVLNGSNRNEELTPVTEVQNDNDTSFRLLPPPLDSNRTFIHQTIARLSDLIPLDSTPIPNAKQAMRPINTVHLKILIETEEAALPPIKVQNSTMGLIVIDGYHRWARATSLEQTTIAVEVLNLDSPIEVLKVAFSANLEHGLPASPLTRTRYALWLISQASVDGWIMSIREAARIAKVSHVAVMEARDKTTKRIAIGKMSDSMDEAPEVIEAKITKAAKVLQKVINLLHDEFSGSQSEALASYLITDYTKQDSQVLHFIADTFTLMATLSDK